MTDGVAEAIAANKNADKIFVGNIHRDFDIQTDDANDLARKLIQAFTRRGDVNLNWPDVVSQFFVQQTEENILSKAKYVPFDANNFEFPLETVRVRDWEAQEGRHSGGYVVDELQTIVQSRIDIELEQVQHMASIIVPVLNEERTIEDVLKSLTALDFEPFGLTKEVLLVDGGSTRPHRRNCAVRTKRESVSVAVAAWSRRCSANGNRTRPRKPDVVLPG